MKNIGDILRLKYCLDVGNWQGELPVLVLDAETFNFDSIPEGRYGRAEGRYSMLFGFPIVWRCKRTVPARKQFDEVYYA